MDPNTATLLMNTIAEVFGVAVRNRLQITALGNVIEKQNPALYAAYKQEIESLSNQRAYEINLVALDNLRAKLLQE